MNTTQLFILILVIHFLADFALQTHEQAQGKGEGTDFLNKWLAYHVGTYTLIWSVVYWILPIDPEIQKFWGWIGFSLLVGIPHYLTDWCTSRIGKPFWKSGDFHNGFVVIGFDQVIHYISLILVIQLFT